MRRVMNCFRLSEWPGSSITTIDVVWSEGKLVAKFYPDVIFYYSFLYGLACIGAASLVR